MDRRFFHPPRVVSALLLILFFLSNGAEGATAPSGRWTDRIPDGTAFAGGDGSPSNPWLIATPQQMALLARKVNENDPLYTDRHYRVTRDIDLSAHYWIPIGRDNVRYLQLISSTAAPFRGTFDGGHKTISGLIYREGRQVHVGFFGFAEKATIKNVVLKGALIDGTYGALTAGLVAGKLLGGVLENCITDGEIRITQDTDVPRKVEDIQSLGGIVGRSFGGAVIDCVNNARIDFAGVRARFLNTGGIVGASSDGRVENCINNAPLVGGLADYNHVGGIVGFNDGGTILDSVNRGAIDENAPPFRSPHASVGGVAGENAGTISGSVNAAPVYGEWVRYASNTGGIAGWNLGTIDRCVNRGNVITWREESYPAGFVRTGGIAGWNSGKAVISDCLNEGGIVGGKSRPRPANGDVSLDFSIVRLLDAAGIVKDFHEANVSADLTGGYSHTGGIVGANYRGTITGCYAWTFPDPRNFFGTGAVVGDNRGEVDNCYWPREISPSAHGIGSGTREGVSALDTAAFASADPFETPERKSRTGAPEGSAWFHPPFAPARPRLKHFYDAGEGQPPRIVFHPSDGSFRYGEPAIRKIFPSFPDGRIAVTGIEPSAAGFSQSSFTPTEIVLRYDGKGASGGNIAVAYDLYSGKDDTPSGKFVASLPVVVLNAPEPGIRPVAGVFSGVAAAAVLLTAAFLFLRRKSARSARDEDEDVYP